MKVIIADDSATMRRIVTNMLSSLNVPDLEVLEADGGDVVMDLLAAHDNVNLILLDWNMPVMNGIDCLKAIRNKDKTKAIPVVMVTTEVMRERIVEALQCGATNYLRKPFDKDKFAEVVGGICGNGSA